MSLYLNTNVTSLQAQYNLGNTNEALSSSLQKLSTGLKINSGADGPAAYVISQQQLAQISSLNAAINNTNKAVNVIQTASGGLGEVNSLLTQIRGLIVDSANLGVNSSTTLAANQSQIQNAVSTITNIANTTQFGNKYLLNGSLALTDTSSLATAAGTATGTIGTGSYAVTVSTAATKANAATTAVATSTFGAAQNETLTINGVNVTYAQVAQGAGATATDVANAVAALNAASAQTGVSAVANATNTGLYLYSNNFGSGNQFTVTSNLNAANSILGGQTSLTSSNGTNIAGTIGGVAATGVGNVLSGTGAYAGLSVTYNVKTPASLPNYYTSATDNSFTSDNTASTQTVSAANALIFQIGSQAGQTVQIGIANQASTALGTGVSSNVASLAAIDVTQLSSNSALAAQFLNVVDAAISSVSSLSGQLGAFQTNNLQANLTNTQAALTNITAANATVSNTDYAAEIANFTHLQTQLQAGSTVLSNANQLTSLVATLLKNA